MMADGHRCLDEVFGLAEAARLVRVDPWTLRRAAQRGQLGSGARRSGKTWIFARQAVLAMYGGAPHGARGVLLRDAARARGLTVARALERRGEFGPGELWREGRRWLASPEAVERVLGTRGASDDT